MFFLSAIEKAKMADQIKGHTASFIDKEYSIDISGFTEYNAHLDKLLLGRF